MDKIERLLDVMENPGHYSTTETEEMLQDPEVKEIFDLLDKTKSSLHPIQTPDIEKEWEKFKNNKVNKRKSPFSFAVIFSHKVAASVIIAILSFTAVAAIVGIGVVSLNRGKTDTFGVEVKVEDNTLSHQQDSIKTLPVHSIESPETVIFDDEPLETILARIGNFYGYKIEFNDNHSKPIRLYYRWKQSSTIEEVVESLNNFEQIHLIIEGDTVKID